MFFTQDSPLQIENEDDVSPQDSASQSGGSQPRRGRASPQSKPKRSTGPRPPSATPDCKCPAYLAVKRHAVKRKIENQVGDCLQARSKVCHSARSGTTRRMSRLAPASSGIPPCSASEWPHLEFTKSELNYRTPKKRLQVLPAL